MNITDYPPTAQLPTALSLPRELRCPLCGDRLSPDPGWISPHWLCPQGHSYSNLQVLLAELRERGWLPEDTEALK